MIILSSDLTPITPTAPIAATAAARLSKFRLLADSIVDSQTSPVDLSEIIALVLRRAFSRIADSMVDSGHTVASLLFSKVTSETNFLVITYTFPRRRGYGDT